VVEEGQLLWKPSEDWLRRSNIRAFTDWLERTRGLQFTDYSALHRWSVEHLEVFWAAIWEYFEVQSSSQYDCVLENRNMPGAEWFPGAGLNYAEHIFRRFSDSKAALVFASEDREPG
jgi:acetoacetyl-CoA synthetase